MKLFKILTLTILAISTTRATQDISSSTGCQAHNSQTSGLRERPAPLENLKSKLIEIITPLTEENETLRKQFELISDAPYQTQSLTLLPIVYEESRHKEFLGTTEADFVDAIFADLRKKVLGIISNLENENTELKRLLTLQKARIPTKEDIKKIGDDTYLMDVEYEEGAFSCVYEKITPENIKFWKWYQTSQHQWANFLTGKCDDKLQFHSGLLGAFTGLGTVLSKMDVADVWISYICTESITTSKKVIPSGSPSTTIIKSPEGYAGMDNIEMVVGIVTSDNVPFYTHMGIARSLYRDFHEMLPHHRAIAPVLHGFSVFMQNYINPTSDKPYMLTQPLKIMRGMILRNFPKNSYVGDNLNLKRHVENVQLYNSEAAKETIQQYKNHPSVIEIDELGYFNLLKDGKVIWRAKNSSSWSDDGHWFFRVANTSSNGDPYVAIDRSAMTELFLRSVKAARPLDGTELRTF